MNNKDQTTSVPSDLGLHRAQERSTSTIPYPIVCDHANICGECKARSDCTYVQSDVALYTPMLYHYFLLRKSHLTPYNKLKSVCLSSAITRNIGGKRRGDFYGKHY